MGGAPASPNAPEAPIDGQLWQEVSPQGIALYPWPWRWDSALGKWLSGTAYLMTTQTARATGNATAGIARLSPLNLGVIAKEVHVLYSKAVGPGYALTLRKIISDSAFGPVFLTLPLPAGVATVQPLAQAVSEELGDCHGLEYTLVVPNGGNARATIQVVSHAARP